MVKKQKKSIKTILIKTSANNKELELHFNLWNSKRKKNLYFDIGIMAEVSDSPYTIEMIIPGKYKDSDVKNLGDILVTNKNICKNIFNCDIDIHTLQHETFVLAEKKINDADNLFFTIESFFSHTKEDVNKTQNIYISSIENNEYIQIIFTINPKDDVYKKYQKCYYRIRIENFDIKPFKIQSTSYAKIFETSYEKNTILDFRINDIKLLDIEDDKDYFINKLTFTKVHFLYITGIKENIIFTTPEIHPRLFETYSWEHYVHSDMTGMVAYHMSIKNTVKSPNFLIKIQENKSSKIHNIIYVLGVICLAIVGNGIFQYFFELFLK